MKARELRELCARALRDPRDLDGWVSLADLVRRVDHLPEGVEARRLGAGMLAALTMDPARQALAETGLELLGLDPGPGDGFGAPGAFWEETGRAERRGGVRWDRATGLPLEVRRHRDAAAMRLVPADEEGPSFYLDSLPVDVGRWARFLEASPRMLPGNWAEQLDRPGEPVRELAPEDPAAYAGWVGASLPDEDQFRRALREDFGVLHLRDIEGRPGRVFRLALRFAGAPPGAPDGSAPRSPSGSAPG